MSNKIINQEKIKSNISLSMGIWPAIKEIGYKDTIDVDTRLPVWETRLTKEFELKNKKLSDHFNELVEKNKKLCSLANTNPKISFDIKKSSKAMDTICVKNALFWNYNGKVQGSWYLCGDGSDNSMRSEHIKWCLKYGFNTILLNLNNESLMSLFKPKQWMKVWDDARVSTVLNFIYQVKAANLIPAIVFYDGPADPSGKYYPILSCSDDLHAAFIKMVCNALNPYTIIYVIGCETSRYWSTERVEAFIWYTKQYSGTDRFVGTHECSAGYKNDKLIMAHKIPAGAQYHCLEMSNHPAKGDDRSVASMVEEATFVCLQAKGVPMWVGEHNTNILGAKSIAQARSMCAINGMYGMNGPM
jgi:hypothetical protein